LTASSMWNQNRSVKLIEKTETEVGRSVGKASIPLSEIPKLFSALQAKADARPAKAIVEQKADHPVPARIGVAESTAQDSLSRLARAGRIVASESLATLKELQSDAEFAAVERVLKLCEVVIQLDAKLARLSEGDPTPDELPTAILRAGGFDNLLTATPFLEAYFSDQEDWYEAIKAISALEAITRLLLARHGIEIYVVKPLTRLSGYRGVEETLDLRGIKQLDAVVKAIQKHGSVLNRGELLVIDCLAPGFIIPTVGSKHPRMCFYNPSAWT